MKNIFLIFSFVIIGLFLQGCVTVSDTLYLQDVEVYGPVNQPPVKFMNSDETKSFIFSPKVYLNNSKEKTGSIIGHSKVNSLGFFQVDTTFTNDGKALFKETEGVNNFDFNGNNMNWQIPSYMIELDADYFVSPKFIISGGISLSEVDQRNLFGWKLGVGFGGFSGDFGLRFDTGLIWQQYEYNASTIIVRETQSLFQDKTREVFFFEDKGKTTNLNHYLSINLHYAAEDAFINPFIGVAYSSQTLLDFEPKNQFEGAFPVVNYRNQDLRGGADISYFVFTPGVSFPVTESIKLIASTRIFVGSDENNISSHSLTIPSLQLEFSL
jgi:hypothetical protein